MKSALEIVEEIDSKSKTLYKSLDSPEDISKILFEMAILSVGLGNYLIEALDSERQLETKYKFNVDSSALFGVNEGKPVSKAWLESKVEHHQVKKDWLETKRQVDVLKIKRADLEKVIDTGRSRLSLIKNDIRKDI